MPQYLPLVCLFSALVDFLLFFIVCKTCKSTAKITKLFLGAVLGGIYAGWCLMPGFHFLGNTFWRLVFLLIRAAVVFGLEFSRLRQCVLFVLLSMALSGAVSLFGGSGALSFALGGIMVIVLCILGLYSSSSQKYIPVELSYGQKQLQITALRDTGNMLRDPITGSSVLVVGADAARILTGLTYEQLRTPVESVGAIPGLRLIPYRSIGDNGFLLALKLPNVRIGKWCGSTLVAFAPEIVGSENTYQALVGGAV